MGTTGINLFRKQCRIHQYLNILHNANQKFTPLIKNEKLVVCHCCYSNNETKIRLATEYGHTSKTNVGLTVTSIVILLKNMISQVPISLKHSIVVEAVIGSIAELITIYHLSISVEYLPKVGKTYENLRSMFAKTYEDITNNLYFKSENRRTYN